MKINDLFEMINNPESNEYGKLLILFQVKPELRYKGKFLPIKDTKYMYGTSDYNGFVNALKASVDSYVFDLIINKEVDRKWLNTWPIFDDEIRRSSGQGEGRGYVFNIYLYPKDQFEDYKDTFLNGYHKHYDGR